MSTEVYVNPMTNYLTEGYLPENDTDAPYPDFTQISAVYVSFIVAYFIVMALALIGNAMVCFVVLNNKKMHTVVNYYIVNLAVCDCLVGGFVLPVKLLELTAPARWNALSDSLCTAMLYLQTIFVFASVLTLLATCLERYSAIVHPLKYRKLQSKTRAKKILLIVWFIPCLVAGPFLYPATAEVNHLSSSFGTIDRLSCFISLPVKFRKAYYTFLFIFIYLIPLIFIGGTCYRIAKCLLQEIALHRQGSLRRQEAYRRKVAKMVIVVVIAFAISWTPYFLVAIITQYQPVNYLEKENFFFTMLCINLFAFLNSCINPFIYAAMSTRFRNGFKRILRTFCCQVTVRSFPVKSRTGRKVTYNRQVIITCNNINALSSDSGSQSDSLQPSAVTMETGWNLRTLFRSTFRIQYVKKPDCHARGANQLKNSNSSDKLPKPSSAADISDGVIISRRKSCNDEISLRGEVSQNSTPSAKRADCFSFEMQKSPSLPDLCAYTVQ